MTPPPWWAGCEPISATSGARRPARVGGEPDAADDAWLARLLDDVDLGGEA